MSEQQLVDCSGSKGNLGCNGGVTNLAFEYAEQTQLETEENYPYIGKDGNCNVKEADIPLLSGYKSVTPKSPKDLAAAL